MPVAGDCLRHDVAGISRADALPWKRLARPPGGHSISASLNFRSVKAPESIEYTIIAASLPTPTPLRAVSFGDAPFYQVVNPCAMTVRECSLRMRCPRSAVQGRLALT
jgi:hypothetical protein